MYVALSISLNSTSLAQTLSSVSDVEPAESARWTVLKIVSPQVEERKLNAGNPESSAILLLHYRFLHFHYFNLYYTMLIKPPDRARLFARNHSWKQNLILPRRFRVNPSI